MTAAALDWEDSRPHEISAALAAVQVDKLERVVIVRDRLWRNQLANSSPLSIQKSWNTKAKLSRILKDA